MSLNLHKPSLTVICARHSTHFLILLAQPGERKRGGRETHNKFTALYHTLIIGPVNVKSELNGLTHAVFELLIN